jgi:hypothetical protein
MTDLWELELISAAIDGEIDIDERVELDLLLESSEEAREFKAELEQLDSLLKDVPDLAPPESLHAQIMANARPQRVQSKPSTLDRLRPLIPGAGLRYAMTAAAGALLAVVFINTQPMLPGTTGFADLVGTMAPDIDSADANIIDSFAVREEGLESLVQLRLSGSVLFLDIHVDTAERLDISVDLGGAGLWPEALTQVEGHFESIAIAGQALQIEALGKQRMTILLRRVDDAAFAGEAKITLEFSSEGTLLQRGTLTATLTGVRQ